MNGIDIRLLQAAITVTEELNFSRAASKLNITQPGLSKQVQDLEERLGIPLFDRDHQAVEPTDACRAFVEDARLAVLHLERAIQRAKAVAKGAESVLNIGKSPYTDPYFISTLSSIRLPLYPSLKLEISSNFSEVLSRQVMTGELDLALFAEINATPRLNLLEVAQAPFYIAFREDEAVASKKHLELTDIADRVWILFGRHLHAELYDKIRHLMDELGVVASALHHVMLAEEAAQLISQHNGFAILPETGAWRVAHSGITIRPLKAKGLVVKTVIATRSDDNSRLLSEFVRMVVRKLTHPKRPGQERLPLGV
jgi:DNA-binding transcriptional LysR family regulator